MRDNVIEFLYGFSYIIFSDQIADTREACGRERVFRSLSFLI